jgi:hypothetical protein
LVALAGIAVWALVDAGVEPTPAEIAADSFERGVTGTGDAKAPASFGDPASRPLPPGPAPDWEPIVACAIPIRALVVDDAGKPVAGVRVILGLKSVSNSGILALSSATTGKDGIAAIPVPEHGEAYIEAAARWVVAVGAPLAMPVDAPVDFDKPPEPIRLTLGPTGRLVVRLVDPDGKPVREQVAVQLLHQNLWNVSRHWLLTTDQGEVAFEPIGVGADVTVEATAKGRRSRTSSREKGPSLPGGDAVTTLVVETKHPLVAGRVLDADRKPLVQTSLRARVVMAPGRSTEDLSVSTDSEGRFRLEIVEPLVAGEKRRLDLEHDVGGRAGDATGTVDLTRPLSPGTTDVGDVVLGPAPPLVAGVVVGDDDRPVPGARLWLSQQGRNEWTPVPGLENPPDPDAAGRFEIRGRCRADRLRVAAYADGHWCEDPVEVSAGSQNVVIRLHAAGAIAGSVVLHESSEPRRLDVAVRRADGDAASASFFGSSETGLVHPDGSFVVTRLRPGSFRVTISNRELVYAVVVDDVVVRGGETSRDPRLQHVRLEPRGRPVYLTVTNAEGRILGDAEAAVVGSPVVGSRARARQELGRVREERIRLFAAGPRTEAVVGAPGYRRKTVVLDSDFKVVVLDRGTPVRVVASGLPSPMPEGWHAEIGLTLESAAAQHANHRPEDHPGRGGFQPIDGRDDGGEVFVGEPGRYLFGIILRGEKGVVSLLDDTIDVTGAPGQTFRFAVPPDALRRALADVEAKIAACVK